MQVAKLRKYRTTSLLHLPPVQYYLGAGVYGILRPVRAMSGLKVLQESGGD